MSPAAGKMRNLMPRIFMTGAGCRIGQAILTRLLSKARVDALLHERTLPPAPGLTLHGGGLAALDACAEAVRQADAVVHVAGVSQAPRPDLYYEVNTRAMARLLALGRADQPFLFISTRSLGDAGGDYGKSKAEAESLLRASGRPFTIVRPPEVYRSKTRQGIDRLLRIALRRRLVVDFVSAGPVTYSPVACGEVADLVTAALGQPRSFGKAYTLFGPAEYTARDILEALRARFGGLWLRAPVPLPLLAAARRCGLPGPLSEDQITRLVMAKSRDDGGARVDFGFAPRPFTDMLRQDDLSYWQR